MKIETTTPESEILQALGRRLAHIRKQQGYSQTRLAEAAGIGVATLRRIEAGQDSQMESWIKILKSLDMIAAIDGLVPENFASPLAEVLADRKRQRRSKPDAAKITWGDERT